MNKIQFNYLIFGLLITLTSILSFTVIYYIFRDWQKILMIMEGMVGSTIGGWLVFIITVVPAISMLLYLPLSIYYEAKEKIKND
ncbi:hypothetical protein C8546_23090 [Salmonella enterica subsp. enterica serovar Muenchen]|nr:hypothetical protein [Salmonella enterica subsp. enterica serovar Muenchen]